MHSGFSPTPAGRRGDGDRAEAASWTGAGRESVPLPAVLTMERAVETASLRSGRRSLPTRT